MLRSLSIRNVVLIERLDLGFERGLSVLTGETGSGKSILLDALGLAIGTRADSDLVSQGADQSSVSAEFDISGNAHVAGLLIEHGLVDNGGLVMRRVIGENGRSRAFINDQPVGVALMREIGGALVEIHGQLESHGLMDASSHVGFVDGFGGHAKINAKVRGAYKKLREIQDQLVARRLELEQARRDEAFLTHATDELAQLAPELGEEETLSQDRSLLMHGEQLVEAVREATDELNKGDGVDAAIRGALQKIERASDKAMGRFDSAKAALERTLIEMNEAVAEIERVSGNLELNPAELERVEDRLFRLRAVARKHNVKVDDLPRLAEEMSARLAGLTDGAEELVRLEKETAAMRDDYRGKAAELTKARKKSAAALKKGVEKEFPHLMLDQAKFDVRFDHLAEPEWGAGGMERVSFEVQTNPNTAAGPIGRVASGGELARIMLAVKVVLAESDVVPTIVFDEVDAGIGGAAAAAVGERLARLASSCQVLVVTHSPQVAARGDSHWRISKTGESQINTYVANLEQGDRVEEIARMLAGSKITEEARAAATSLINGKGAGAR